MLSPEEELARLAAMPRAVRWTDGHRFGIGRKAACRSRSASSMRSFSAIGRAASSRRIARLLSMIRLSDEVIEGR